LPGTVVHTDGLVQRERFFGRIHEAAGAATVPGDVERTSNRQRDYAVDAAATDPDRWRTTTRLRGAESLSASSSASDAGALGGSVRGSSPYAAVDGELA